MGRAGPALPVIPNQNVGTELDLSRLNAANGLDLSWRIFTNGLTCPETQKPVAFYGIPSYLCNTIANMENPEHILKSRKVPVTALRVKLLRLLEGPGKALSRREIESALEGEADRATIYRNLRALTENGIIHRIAMNGMPEKYKLANSGRSKDHPHFYCAGCERLLCLSAGLINTGKVPGGFQVQSAHLVLEGLCNQCNTKEAQ